MYMHHSSLTTLITILINIQCGFGRTPASSSSSSSSSSVMNAAAYGSEEWTVKRVIYLFPPAPIKPSPQSSSTGNFEDNTLRIDTTIMPRDITGYDVLLCRQPRRHRRSLFKSFMHRFIFRNKSGYNGSDIRVKDGISGSGSGRYDKCLGGLIPHTLHVRSRSFTDLKWMNGVYFTLPLIYKYTSYPPPLTTSTTTTSTSTTKKMGKKVRGNGNGKKWTVGESAYRLILIPPNRHASLLTNSTTPSSSSSIIKSFDYNDNDSNSNNNGGRAWISKSFEFRAMVNDTRFGVWFSRVSLSPSINGYNYNNYNNNNNNNNYNSDDTLSIQYGQNIMGNVGNVLDGNGGNEVWRMHTRRRRLPGREYMVAMDMVSCTTGRVIRSINFPPKLPSSYKSSTKSSKSSSKGQNNHADEREGEGEGDMLFFSLPSNLKADEEEEEEDCIISEVRVLKPWYIRLLLRLTLPHHHHYRNHYRLISRHYLINRAFDENDASKYAVSKGALRFQRPVLNTKGKGRRRAKSRSRSDLQQLHNSQDDLQGESKGDLSMEKGRLKDGAKGERRPSPYVNNMHKPSPPPSPKNAQSPQNAPLISSGAESNVTSNGGGNQVSYSHVRSLRRFTTSSVIRESS